MQLDNLIVTVIGVALGIAATILVAHPRRLSHEPKEPTRLPRIRIWRSKSFRFGLYLVEGYADAIENFAGSTSAGDQFYDLEDLRRWGYQTVLLSASTIVADSQSKANLFRVTSVGTAHPPQLNLGSFEFAGNIPLSQIADARGAFRELRAGSDGLPLALKVVEQERIRLVRLNRKTLSKAEYAIGTTDILAIPIMSEFNGAERGTVASLTVALRVGRFRQMLYKSNWFFERSQLMRRAEALQRSTRRLVKVLNASDIGE